MAEYIDRAKAVDEFEQCNAKTPRWTPQRVKTLLLRIPTADVAPVVHGRWGQDYYFDEPVTRCSACKVGFAKGHKAERFTYCPHCGAKMDGGVADD